MKCSSVKNNAQDALVLIISLEEGINEAEESSQKGKVVAEETQNYSSAKILQSNYGGLVVLVKLLV